MYTKVKVLEYRFYSHFSKICFDLSAFGVIEAATEFPIKPQPHLKLSRARFAKIEELDLAALGTQTASIFTLRFAKNAVSNSPKMDSIRNPTAAIKF